MHIRDRQFRLVLGICQGAGSGAFLGDLRHQLTTHGIPRAIESGNTAALYDWLMAVFSFQGVSDAAARGYLAAHGNVTYLGVERLLHEQRDGCEKLASFKDYRSCGFRKAAWTCANPKALPACPVGRPRLRNGNLHQTAFSLYFFLRDVCEGDLVGFIDQCLENADRPDHPERAAMMRDALMGRLRNIYGVSNKVLNMAFADFLLGGDRRRRRWRTVGASMIAIDTLLHNFLHRTGLIQRYGAIHRYGAFCYREGGCAEIIDRLARIIDAQQFNPGFPSYFPRFVQHCLWRHCATGELDMCNGRHIQSRHRCRRKDCVAYQLCDRRRLAAQSPKKAAIQKEA